MKLSVGGVLDLYAVWFPVPCPMDMTCMSDRHVRTCHFLLSDFEARLGNIRPFFFTQKKVK